MREFTALRERARDRRDRAIASAKAEYATNLKQIAELEQRLLGRTDPRHMKLSAAIEHVIPRDQPFSINDVMAALEGLDSGRIWNRVSVSRHLTKLRELKLLRRVRRATVNEPAAYVRVDGPGENAAEDKSLRQVVTEVVKRPMFIAEVVHAVLEAGYKTTMARRDSFRTHVIRQLKAAGCRERGGKWVPA